VRHTGRQTVRQGANIVLVGFMGTGKTSVGKLLAGRLGMEFLDMDDVIVDR
jgi:shikimate kinase